MLVSALPLVWTLVGLNLGVDLPLSWVLGLLHCYGSSRSAGLAVPLGRPLTVPNKVAAEELHGTCR